MIRAISHKLSNINQKEAARLLEEHPYKNQRKVDQRRVDLYSRQMRNGEWYPDGEITLCAVGSAGKLHVINGQHRLWAVIESDTVQRFLVVVMECDYPAELDKLYAITDSIRQRGPADRIRTSGLVEEWGIPSWKLGKYNAALKYIAGGFGAGGRQKPLRSYDEEVNALHRYEAQIFELERSMSGAADQVIRAYMRQPALAVMLESLYYGGMHHKTFWEQQVQDEVYGKRDPGRVLQRFLLTSQVAGGNTRRNYKGVNIVSSGYMARYAASCWNAYVEGRELSWAVVNNDNVPIKILQTPWNGKKSMIGLA